MAASGQAARRTCPRLHRQGAGQGAAPYGVYDLAENVGWVGVGISHDTAEFAVNTIRTWWKRLGRRRYPRARSLLIAADGGGSNGTRVRLWKWELQKFANRTGLTITVCHLPPGTSKWNKIEHRLFSFRIVAGRYDVEHPRRFEPYEGSTLPEHRARQLAEAAARYVQPHVPIVDELGYLAYGTDAANVLFHVVNERHRRKPPMVVTTNKSPLTQWGDALHDVDLAEAIADRILERGRLILLDGPSYRTRHLDLDPARKPGSREPARISGTHSKTGT